jgi:hypothetical protein
VIWFLDQISELQVKMAHKDSTNAILMDEIFQLKKENIHLREYMNEITIMKINLF